MKFAEEFNFEAARNIADAAFRAETGEYLDRLEVDVLRGVFQGHKYPKIQEETGQTYDYIKRIGKKIWDTLSAALGEKVTQTNVREVLWRRWQAAEDTPSPNMSQNNQYLSVTNPEFPEGAVALDSAFYVKRPPIEALCYQEILQPGSLIRIKAPHNMGKTWLMNRILADAAKQGYRTASFNLLQAEEEVIKNLYRLLCSLCIQVGKQLQLSNQLAGYWDEDLGNNDNCTIYFEEYILVSKDTPLLLALDNVDRVFQYGEVAPDFFALLRSWHEAAKSNESWKKLRLVVAHSTEVYIPLNVNCSPFNVGLPIELPDFSIEQVEDLAKRHGLIWNQSQVEQLIAMVGGHPYLVDRVLAHFRMYPGTQLDELLQLAATEEGIYRNYLRELREHLLSDSKLAAALKKVVETSKPVRIDADDAFKLRSMGLVRWQGDNVEPCCNLYRLYFHDRLEIN